MTRTAGPALVVLVLTGLLAAPAVATPPGTNGMLVWQREAPRVLPRLLVAPLGGDEVSGLFPSSSRHGDFEGTFSPVAPNQMAFTRWPGGNYTEDIMVGDMVLGSVRRIRRPGSADIAPSYSPDGTHIVYFQAPRPKKIRRDRPGPPEQVHVMSVDGSADRRLTPKGRRSIDPDWSPDGTRIVYSEVRILGDRGEQRLRIMNADGSGDRSLTAFGGRDEINPKWMPDGQTIVFENASPRGSHSDIATIKPDGSGLRTVLRTPRWETNPIPSPDGTLIAFTSDRDRPDGAERLGLGTELYLMGVDGAGITRLTNNRQADLFPDWQRLP